MCKQCCKATLLVRILTFSLLVAYTINYATTGIGNLIVSEEGNFLLKRYMALQPLFSKVAKDENMSLMNG